jgi:hypothetical protein
MERVFLHLKAFGLFAPAFVLLCAGNLLCNIAGVLYITMLCFGWFSTCDGKRFLCRYYREILRMEKDLLNA